MSSASYDTYVSKFTETSVEMTTQDQRGDFLYVAYDLHLEPYRLTNREDYEYEEVDYLLNLALTEDLDFQYERRFSLMNEEDIETFIRSITADSAGAFGLNTRMRPTTGPSPLSCLCWGSEKWAPSATPRRRRISPNRAPPNNAVYCPASGLAAALFSSTQARACSNDQPTSSRPNCSAKCRSMVLLSKPASTGCPSIRAMEVIRMPCSPQGLIRSKWPRLGRS